MSQGVFFYQSPNTNSIHGYEGEWNVVDKIENCNNGFVMTSFNKDHVFSMSHPSPVEMTMLDGVALLDSKSIEEVGKEDYQKLVQSAIDFCKIENGKVVMSRIKRHSLMPDFKLIKLFQSLCDKYTHAFNYLCHIPEVGTWIGASPEQLLVGNAPQFEIASLAGSRSVDNRFEWSDKEIYEQNLVTHSIETTLNNQSINYTKTATKTIKSGNVEHLFTGFLTDNCCAPLLLAEQLHPTPAVSGFPRDKAIEFINKREPHQRDFYAGIVGVIANDRYDLYVNLRSAQIYKDKIDLYVGGGVTAESIPVNEWEETEFKSQTLLSIIEKM